MGSAPAPGLISFMPIFLIGVTFGLAMDYQVFLVTRMREHYSQTGGKPSPGSPYSGVDESTIVGFTQGARVVTAAAIIMISVFIGVLLISLCRSFRSSVSRWPLPCSLTHSSFVCRWFQPPCSSWARPPGGCQSGWTGSCLPSILKAPLWKKSGKKKNKHSVRRNKKFPPNRPGLVMKGTQIRLGGYEPRAL